MENGIVNVTNRIDQRRFKISICCINELGPMAARIAEGAASVTCLGQGPGKSARLFKRIYGLLRTQRVDILHTHNYYTSVYGVPAARAAGVRVICGQHGFVHDPRTNRIVKRRAEIALCVLSHRVCCVARELEDIVCADFGIARRKVTTILNGVDFGRFSGDGSDRAQVRQDLGIAAGELVVGSVGRLHYEKNYGLLITTVAGLSTRLPIRLILVGDGPDAGHLKGLTRSLGCDGTVMMLGERRDVPALMRAMDVFVLSSRFEGLPNTVLEAMCAGLPVVASRVGGIPDVVDDGRSGFLFPSEEGTELALKLERLLGDAVLRRDMGACGQDIAKTRFSMARMVGEYEGMYQGLRGGRHR
jgi:sugar transferase (PEP-CTERM/EpsH1 system associated)